MEVFLVRHGIAQDPAATGSDEARRLTAEGLRKTEQAARGFRKRVNELNLILHSPYVRAAETAEIFGREFPAAEVRETEGFTPYDDPQNIFLLLRQNAACPRLMVVGHEPNLTAVAGLLLLGATNPIREFEKAGVVAIQWEGPGKGKLLFSLKPDFS
jgi:phosphohistidine phosphatase